MDNRTGSPNQQSVAGNVEQYIEDFCGRYSVQEVLEYLDRLKALSVLVVGETIIDEYVYGDVIGKSGKEPILALRTLREEAHVGGGVVIANHLSSFCEKVHLITYLGEDRKAEEFVRDALSPNVEIHLHSKSQSPTIVKRRLVETYTGNKLLEVYEMNDNDMNVDEIRLLNDDIANTAPACDVVIAADYGHGLISDSTVEELVNGARFISINTQINAGNNGYHTLSKYPRADYICVHEGEIRLDQRSRNGDVCDLVRTVADRMGCKALMITRGRYGTLLYNLDGGFSHAPALTTAVVDRVGAGDSVLAVSSLCVAAGLPPDVTNFVSNMVGAQAVTIVGNQRAVSRDRLSSDIRQRLDEVADG